MIRKIPESINIKDLWVTASAGITEHVYECDIDEWKTSAHRALLKARKKGGNCCELGEVPNSHVSKSWGS